VRNAIDLFHQDWRAGLISSPGQVASDDGYPLNLQVLVDGVSLSGDVSYRRYLRRLPENPFLKTKPPEEQWRFIGYRDKGDSESWSGNDIYDLRVNTERTGLDGTPISDW
jgi:general secretion pathway protein G